MRRISQSAVQQAIIFGGEDFAETQGFEVIRALIWDGVPLSGAEAMEGRSDKETMEVFIADVVAERRARLLDQFEAVAGNIAIGIRPASQAGRADAIAGKTDILHYVFRRKMMLEDIGHLHPSEMIRHFQLALRKNSDILIWHTDTKKYNLFKYGITLK